MGCTESHQEPFQYAVTPHGKKIKKFFNKNNRLIPNPDYFVDLKNHFDCGEKNCIFNGEKRHIHRDKITVLDDVSIYCDKCDRVITLVSVETYGYKKYDQGYDHCADCCTIFEIEYYSSDYIIRSLLADAYEDSAEGKNRAVSRTLLTCHCSNCHFTYINSHCCECKMEIFKNYKHCCGCKINYDESLFHCQICHKTCDLKEKDYCHIACDSCNKVYNPLNFLHCDICHLTYPQTVKNHTCEHLQKKKIKDECSVCLEEFKTESNKTITLKCSHKFHKCCLNIWFIDNASCPLCRDTCVRSELKHDLFDDV
jgi:Ring finger domain